ncbi:hypothetical protein SKAU_G00347880 [Synaphobranchus kaupii]|uniref:Isotocin n=1 Tax=Synaphobranchus kaupii TaxID=118154 RepID=A0A9Q1IGX3_SYNKA|nr:hypothetical protein SKAU_G00347880 [Synaphobranchus kaupii]
MSLPWPAWGGYIRGDAQARSPKITASFALFASRPQKRTMSGATVSVYLLSLLSVCSACYISNCPIGGKRSLEEYPSRKCMSCGPGDRGRCFGPSICCSEGLGCLAGGKACGSEEGRCAAPGVCCDSEGCSLDQSCVGGDIEDDQGRPIGKAATLAWEPNSW